MLMIISIGWISPLTAAAAAASSANSANTESIGSAGDNTADSSTSAAVTADSARGATASSDSAAAEAASSDSAAETADGSEGWPADIDITAPSACVIDVDSGQFLYEKDAATSRYPASITKIMTAIVALENSSLDETVTFSADAVYKNEGNTSHIARDLDEQMTMEQCLYAMLLESANECAWAIAEHVGGGSEETFVDMMNAKAQELGCVNTHFANPNGLHDDQHWTCAHDMALIARAAYQIPEFATITGTKQYQIPPTNKHADPTPLNNHHCMLNFYKTSRYLYDGCVGGKTGYTGEAGFTLVTYVQKNGMTLASVVMSEPDRNTQYTDTIALMDHYTTLFHSCNIKDYQQELKTQTDTAIRSLANGGEDVEADYTGSMILPASVTPYDCTMDLCRLEEGTYDASGRPVVAREDFSYGGHSAGSLSLVYTGSGQYPFNSEAASSSEDTGSSSGGVETFLRRHVWVLLIAAGILVVLLLQIIWKIRQMVLRRRRKAHQMSCEEREEILKRIKERKTNDDGSDA